MMTVSAAETTLPPYFNQLSRADAKAYLNQFVAELPESRARLADMLTAAGKDPALASSPSPGSLEPIWEAAVGSWHLGWQEGHDHATDPFSRRDPPLGALGPLEGLPSWFGHDRLHYAVFAPATLWVIDVLARHLGEVIAATYAHLTWRLGPARPANNVDRNMLVVGTSRGWVEPRRLTRVLVWREIEGRSDSTVPRTLLDVYERNTWYADTW